MPFEFEVTEVEVTKAEVTEAEVTEVEVTEALEVPKHSYPLQRKFNIFKP